MGHRKLVIVSLRAISFFLRAPGRGGKEKPTPSDVCELILFDQIFTREPFHGHIVNGFVVYVDGLI
jgi:hypothetical protein